MPLIKHHPNVRLWDRRLCSLWARKFIMEDIEAKAEVRKLTAQIKKEFPNAVH